MSLGVAARSETELEAFAPLFDMETVLPIVRETVAPVLLPGRVIVDGSVASVRRRTYDDPAKRAKSSVLVRYDLSVAAPGSEPTAVELHLRGFLNGRSSRRGISAGQHLAPVPALDAYAWVFPGDPSIPGLSRLADATTTLDHIHPAVAARVEKPSRADVRPLRYKPEDRCTLEVTIHGEGASRQAVIAKSMASAARAAELNRVAKQVWRQSCDSQTAFAVPEPIGFDEPAATMWLSKLPGRCPRREDLDAGVIDRIATALASLHAVGQITNELRRPVDQLSQTRLKIAGLTAVVPSSRPALDALVEDLSAALDRLEPDRLVVSHGAFRRRQLLVTDDSVGIVDFDSIAMGDCCEDIADFCLDLEPDPQLWTDKSLVARFIEVYEQAAGCTVDRYRLRWYLPVHLIKRAYWLRTAVGSRLDRTTELTRRIEHACASATTLSRSTRRAH